MTVRTRGRVLFCLILGLVTLPAEAILLPVARTPSPAVAASEWASELSVDELRDAAMEIDAYPVVYRRSIMGRLDPQDRADAWRAHAQRFLARETSLSPAQIDVVQRAIVLLEPESFTPPLSADVRARITAVFEESVTVLGPKMANELFVTLGPTQLTRANALPWTQRLADRVRFWRVSEARLPDCNCNVDIDTCDISFDPWLQCSEMYSCDFDLEWPMCGPLWSWACTGWCKIIRWPEVY
jgi:hypothetical protein